MAAQFEFSKGLTARIPLIVKNAGGSKVNADSTPTIANIQINGANGTISTATITQNQDATPANIVGEYTLSVPTAGLAVNDIVVISVSATVGGFVATTQKTLIVISSDRMVPTIE